RFEPPVWCPVFSLKGWDSLAQGNALVARATTNAAGRAATRLALSQPFRLENQRPSTQGVALGQAVPALQAENLETACKRPEWSTDSGRLRSRLAVLLVLRNSPDWTVTGVEPSNRPGLRIVSGRDRSPHAEREDSD